MFRLDRCLRRVSFLIPLAVLPFLALQVPAQAEDAKLPVPRFVSLDSNLVNLRAGPGKEYPILWVYQRKGLPVEIIQEFDTWRRIRDRDGTIGWVQGNLLSGKRTVQIIGKQRAMTRDAHGGNTVAYVDPGVVARLVKCDDSACRIEVQGYDGWVPRGEIWGTYPDEKLQGN
ncbi:SH3 domain-containing protein [Dongia soli]|uniref:SH3 domain-containing protein n=1 Tax=Dongia soli TaxID=600628 RepID=A0ABU5E7J0_9PROT|nr:SH3 domain-containing protein [Dongia soli]MDY0881826.1 SH3 domain-containing protein [Dongia soli]